MTAEQVRTVSTAEFETELAAVTRARPRTTHLYLSLEPGGRIWTQWEEPGLDHPRRYQVVARTGPVCPHCVIVTAVRSLTSVLPVDALRTARAGDLYEAVLRSRRLPSLALARPGWGAGPSWLVDCHSAPGNPHTPADCDIHRDHGLAPDGLIAGIGPLPRPLVGHYPNPAAAADDVLTRMTVAQDWRKAAEDIGGSHPPAAGALRFLRERCILGIPFPSIPGSVYGLRPGAPDDERSVQQTVEAVIARFARPVAHYQETACLVPIAEEPRLPSFAGAVDVSTAEPTRTLRLPMNAHPLSRLGRGVVLLFEARHLECTHAVSDARLPRRDWEAEADLHVFEFDLLARFGGYRAAVTAFRDRLLVQGDLLERPDRVLSRRQRRALAEPFGSVDDNELDLWTSVAYRNAIYLCLSCNVSAFATHLQHQAGV